MYLTCTVLNLTNMCANSINLSDSSLLLVKYIATCQVRLSFLTAPSFALLDHPLPLVLRLENNCERTVGVPVLRISLMLIKYQTNHIHFLQVELDLSLSSPSCGLLTWYEMTSRTNFHSRSRLDSMNNSMN